MEPHRRTLKPSFNNHTLDLNPVFTSPKHHTHQEISTREVLLSRNQQVQRIQDLNIDLMTSIHSPRPNQETHHLTQHRTIQPNMKLRQTPNQNEVHLVPYSTKLQQQIVRGSNQDKSAAVTKKELISLSVNFFEWQTMQGAGNCSFSTSPVSSAPANQQRQKVLGPNASMDQSTPLLKSEVKPAKNLQKHQQQPTSPNTSFFPFQIASYNQTRTINLGQNFAAKQPVAKVSLGGGRSTFILGKSPSGKTQADKSPVQSYDNIQASAARNTKQETQQAREQRLIEATTEAAAQKIVQEVCIEKRHSQRITTNKSPIAVKFNTKLAPPQFNDSEKRKQTQSFVSSTKLVQASPQRRQYSEATTNLLTPYLTQPLGQTIQRQLNQSRGAMPRGRVIKQRGGKFPMNQVPSTATPDITEELFNVITAIKDSMNFNQFQQPYNSIQPSQNVQAKTRETLPQIEKKGLNTRPFLKFQVLKGNNAGLIRKVMQATRQSQWYEMPATFEQGTQNRGFQQPIGHFHFRWAPHARQVQYERLSQNLMTQAFNHLEGHAEISTKDKLLANITRWHTENKVCVFQNMLPLTFCLNVTVQPSGELCPQSLRRQLRPFKRVFNLLANYSKKGCTQKNLKFGQQPLVIPESHFDGKNIWILKPTSLNRGNGIHIVSDYQQIKKLMNQTVSSAAAVPLQSTTSPQAKPKTSKTQKPIEQVKSFILQKYIERPFLIKKRKFDIRVWILITQDLDTYFFKEGYLRLSSAEYQLSNLNDDYVHLTNNAIQRTCPQYGKHEDGNQLSFEDLRAYLRQYNVDFDSTILPKMKHQTQIAFQSVGKKLNANRRKHCFELFGLDYMLDEAMNVWLIEANTNPCLEESSKLLSVLLPRLIDDLLKLTLDVVFPPRSDQRTTQASFVVPGYDDDVNMWEKLEISEKPQALAGQKFLHMVDGQTLREVDAEELELQEHSTDSVKSSSEDSSINQF